MAVLKHIAIKNADYSAAVCYLKYQHDERHLKPLLDENGSMMLRSEFHMNGVNCNPDTFDLECEMLNDQYRKNYRYDEVKSHHYIISFDPRDKDEHHLTGEKAQTLGLEFVKNHLPGHQALVCTHTDGHNGSGNIHVHIIINSLRKLDIEPQSYTTRSIDCKAGYKHHLTKDYLKYLQQELMNLCQRENLYQVDLLSPAQSKITEAEYWLQKRGQKQLLELDTRTAPSQTTVYPLSGFLRCADCGQNMIRRTVTKNGKKYQYYHCSTYKNGGGCTPHMINSEKLTESVLAAIRHQVTLLVEAEKVLSNAELASGEQIGIKILDSQITALEAELERYSNLKIRLYQDLCDDVVSREEYGEMNTRFAQKIKEAQDKIQEIREKKREALKHDTLLPTWLEEFKQYEHIKTLERRVVVELIDHIDVHSKTEIEIHFCFEDELHSITEKFMEYQAHHGNEVAEE